jgi:hypothetical protein
MRKVSQKRKQKMLRRCKPKRCDKGRPQLSSAGISYELGDRTNAITAGGVPLIHKMCEGLGLKEAIDNSVHVLKQHNPYYESDHVLNIAFNILAGGSRIEHIEYRRCDTAYLDALGTHSIPDPTTAGDFCRRFVSPFSIDQLQEAFNQVRLTVWSHQDADFFKQAIIEADGTMCETEGECKEGMDISHKGKWGYHPLVVSLANTAEPLYLLNRSGNRPSHEGAARYFDKAAKLCQTAGFKRIHFRGDTDFTQTKYLDGWDKDKITFTFGMDARENVVDLAESLDSSAWTEFEPPQRATGNGSPRRKPTNVKEEVVDRRGYRHLRLTREEVAEFPYRPCACKKDYRLVVLKKTIEVTEGLFEHLEWETRYFFYLTNRKDLSPSEVVIDARKRCDQENLNAHLKNGVHALTMPLNTLHANWAYAVMAALAWSLKAWAALLLPVTERWAKKHKEQKHRLLRMEFHTFRQALMNIPAQIVRTGRRLLVRLLNWNEWTPAFFRLADAMTRPSRI